MKSIKLICEKPYGIVVAPEARRYVQYTLKGVEKVLIVSNETVFELFGNGLKKSVKGCGAEVYTFIFPAGENGKSKHVLDKLLILMAELGIKNTDCLIALGGRSVASLTGFAAAVYKGGVPYMFVPTTLMGMVSPMIDGKASVDLLGKPDVLKLKYYPIAAFCDTDYLKTLPAQYMQNGYAEIIRRAMVVDKNLLTKMEEGEVSAEELVYSALDAENTFRSEGMVEVYLDRRRQGKFALNFSSAAEKASGLNLPYGRLIAFGIVQAIDTAMALGMCDSLLEEKILKLFKKYGIKWDIGINKKEIWKKLSDDGRQDVKLVLPKAIGRCSVTKVAKEKIKEII